MKNLFVAVVVCAAFLFASEAQAQCYKPACQPAFPVARSVVYVAAKPIRVVHRMHDRAKCRRIQRCCRLLQL